MNSIIKIDQVTHRYGQKLALDGISFAVDEGEVFGLLGPNGVGKTTTIRLLNGLLKPAGGKINVLGIDPQEKGEGIRRQVGVLTETPALYERLNALENLIFFGTLAGMGTAVLKARIDELLGFFDLAGRARDRVGAYSKGMKQRLALARALLINPRLLYLDEPTSGLDPEAARQVHDLIRDVRRQDGHTVVLCTHNLYEAEQLCDRMAVMGKGRILAVGSLAQLRSQAAPEYRMRFTFLQPFGEDAVSQLKNQSGVVHLERLAEDELIIQVEGRPVVPALISRMTASGLPIASAEPCLANLEEIYFRLQRRIEEKEK
jgi:ABC-2 type transport system ATP-binding protein